MIYRIALNNLKNPADAEDILQDVLTELITKCPTDKTDEGVKYWLIRITVNKCNGFRRLVWQTRTEGLENHLTLEAPEQELVMEEIFELPKKQRSIIYLYYYEKYTISEIAEILRINPNTVSSDLRRARKKLKTILEEERK